MCQQDKVDKKNGVGLLQPLPILERPFPSTSMNFNVEFLKVYGLRSILVVVDRFSRHISFIVGPHACPVDVVAKLFHKHFVKYFGIPDDIISDRDTQFTRLYYSSCWNWS